MNETRTQRQFKREIQKLEKENKLPKDHEVYVSKRTVRFEEPRNNNSLVGIIALVFIVSSVFGLHNRFIGNNVSTSNPLAAAGIYLDSSQGALSKSQAEYLTNVNRLVSEVDGTMDAVYNRSGKPSEFELQDSIILCDILTIELEKIYKQDIFAPYLLSIQNYIFYARQSFESYLKYHDSGNNYDFEEININLEKTNEARSLSAETLIAILEQNGYRYERTKDGLRYWYTNN